MLQDQKYARIAPLAAQRVRRLLEDAQRFMRKAGEAGKEKRQQARERKRTLYNDIANSNQPNGHRAGRGLQCFNCKTRVAVRQKYQELLSANDDTCEWAHGLPSMEAAVSPRTPRLCC